MEKNISKEEEEISNIKKQIDKTNDWFNKGEQCTSTAQIKLSIMHISESKIDPGVKRDIRQGLLYKYSAGSDEGPSDKKVSEWEAIVSKFLSGDSSSETQLQEINETFMTKWVERNNNLVQKRNEYEKNVNCKKRKVVFWRHISIALQILGLIAVLLKDTATTS
ncbi:MAG: hypothetical protein GY816_16200 [Cytophagales bacterium]|nr:hypothetical protein [Cytophagales bacterium]